MLEHLLQIQRPAPSLVKGRHGPSSQPETNRSIPEVIQTVMIKGTPGNRTK
jgi:hypothetical protein